MVHHIAITKARVNLGQVVRRAHLNNEYFILEKDGIPIAGILGIAELEDYLELQNPALKEQIRKRYLLLGGQFAHHLHYSETVLHSVPVKVVVEVPVQRLH